MSDIEEGELVCNFKVSSNKKIKEESNLSNIENNISKKDNYVFFNSSEYNLKDGIQNELNIIKSDLDLFSSKENKLNNNLKKIDFSELNYSNNNNIINSQCHELNRSLFNSNQNDMNLGKKRLINNETNDNSKIVINSIVKSENYADRINLNNSNNKNNPNNRQDMQIIQNMQNMQNIQNTYSYQIKNENVTNSINGYSNSFSNNEFNNRINQTFTNDIGNTEYNSNIDVNKLISILKENPQTSNIINNLLSLNNNMVNDVKKEHNYQKNILSDNNQNYSAPSRLKSKKLPCNFYKNGACTKGDNCTFSHDIKQESKKTVGIFINFKELCKYYLGKSCLKGNSCTFSHETKNFPCKYFNAMGYCDAGQSCSFSHKIMTSLSEINKFINSNLDFFKELHNKIGFSNLDPFYFNYLNQNDLNLNKNNDNIYSLNFNTNKNSSGYKTTEYLTFDEINGVNSDSKNIKEEIKNDFIEKSKDVIDINNLHSNNIVDFKESNKNKNYNSFKNISKIEPIEIDPFSFIKTLDDSMI